MINILVTITVSEQNRPQTLRLLEQLTEASQQENGNISYQHYLHPTDPEQLLIVELWQNGEVLAAHEATRHFTTLLPQIEKLSDGIDIRKFDAERSSTDSRGRSSFLAASERDRNPESTG